MFDHDNDGDDLDCEEGGAHCSCWLNGYACCYCGTLPDFDDDEWWSDDSEDEE